jgi:hypothetical protein
LEVVLGLTDVATPLVRTQPAYPVGSVSGVLPSDKPAFRDDIRGLPTKLLMPGGAAPTIKFFFSAMEAAKPLA